MPSDTWPPPLLVEYASDINRHVRVINAHGLLRRCEARVPDGTFITFVTPPGCSAQCNLLPVLLSEPDVIRCVLFNEPACTLPGAEGHVPLYSVTYGPGASYPDLVLMFGSADGRQAWDGDLGVWEGLPISREFVSAYYDQWCKPHLLPRLREARQRIVARHNTSMRKDDVLTLSAMMQGRPPGAYIVSACRTNAERQVGQYVVSIKRRFHVPSRGLVDSPHYAPALRMEREALAAPTATYLQAPTLPGTTPWALDLIEAASRGTPIDRSYVLRRFAACDSLALQCRDRSTMLAAGRTDPRPLHLGDHTLGCGEGLYPQLRDQRPCLSWCQMTASDAPPRARTEGTTRLATGRSRRRRGDGETYSNSNSKSDTRRHARARGNCDSDATSRLRRPSAASPEP